MRLKRWGKQNEKQIKFFLKLLDIIPIWNETLPVMWQIEPIPQWEKDRKWYEKKRPGELSAVLNNLRRYMLALNAAKNPKAFMAGYLHPEPHGVIAISQSGGGGNLQETRLYVYPREEQKLLYIITIGNKDEQSTDIQFCTDFVKSLGVSM